MEVTLVEADFKKVKVVEFRKLFSNSFQENERIFVVHKVQVGDRYVFFQICKWIDFLALA